MKRDCNCKEWIEGIAQLNDMCYIGQIHGIPYTGGPFMFCPYCGLPLMEMKDEQPNFCDYD